MDAPTLTTDGLAPGWTAALSAAASWRPVAARAVVVVPHPDDEAVMFGGLIAHLVADGAHVSVLAVTDGGAAYPELVDDWELAGVRRSEQVRALCQLGVPAMDTFRMGIPDGAVADHEAAIAGAIAGLVRFDAADLVIAPWEFDHHTDHEACGRAARAAIAASGRAVTGAFGVFWSMLREPAGDVHLSAVELSDEARARKRRAIDCHNSQVGVGVSPIPMLGATELAVCAWPREHYVVERR